jgi:uncharacterized protein YneF (UPF0154 family)
MKIKVLIILIILILLIGGGFLFGKMFISLELKNPRKKLRFHQWLKKN